MANNRCDRDAFIIFGVRDSDYSVVGVEGDTNRRNQQKIIDQLFKEYFKRIEECYIYSNDENLDKEIKTRLKVAEVLNKMLKEFRFLSK